MDLHFGTPLRAAIVAGGLLAAALPAMAGTFVYVSNADSQELSVLAFDRSTGRLSPVETLAVGGTVMPLAVSPDKRFLYAALRSQPFRVVSFAIDPACVKQKLPAVAGAGKALAGLGCN